MQGFNFFEQHAEDIALSVLTADLTTLLNHGLKRTVSAHAERKTTREGTLTGAGQTGTICDSKLFR